MRLSLRTALLAVAPAILCTTVAPAQQQQADPLQRPLPTDSKVTVGTLPNGLRYYIRQNTMPEKRAELRLVVNAGSILEDADQQGLAHFVEHTAFNGTRNFKKNDLVSYLQSIGVRFGPDLNAYTGFDETVYILPVPTDSAHIVEKAFQILEDWAHGQIFDSTEVVAERGVVVEEWRGRRGAGDRMLQQWLPIAFKDSRYAERLPIGKVEILQSATPQLLRRFYQDWYRPDLMAVVAVGDFDPAQIEALITKHFSSIVMPSSPRPRVLHDVPDNAQPLVAVATDREAASTSINLIFKRDRDDLRTIGEYRRALMERLYFGMLNARFQEITQKPDAPFLGAGASKGSFFARTKEGFFLGAGVADDGIARGLEALLVETRRVDQFGFLASELDRQKQAILRNFQRSYDEREKTNSGAFVEEYVSHFLTGEAFPGIEFEYQLAQALMPTITLAELNAMAKEWITDENRIVIVQAPQKDGVRTPTQAELLAVLDRAARAPSPTSKRWPRNPSFPGCRRAAASCPSGRSREWTSPNGGCPTARASS
jgi:zinc protease